MEHALSRKLLLIVLLGGIFHYGTLAQILPGETIEIDTITYKPKQTFPFDQEFVLKVVIDGKVEPRFAAIFTLDKYGEKIEIKKKDYDQHIDRLLTNRKGEKLKGQRKKDRLDTLKMKGEYPYATFVSNGNYISRYFLPDGEIKAYYKDKKTTVYAKMPPLEPSTNYKFALVLKDDDIISKTQEFANYYYLSVIETDPQKVDQNEELMVATYHDIVNKKKSQSLNFEPPGLDQMKDQIQDTLITFDGRAYTTATEFRFLVVKDGDAADIATLLAITEKPRYTAFSKSTMMEVKLPWRDSQGNALVAGTKYKVYVLVKTPATNTLLQSRAFELNANEVKDLEPTVFAGVDNSLKVRYRIFEKLRESADKLAEITDDPATIDSIVAAANHGCLQLLLSVLIECNCEDKILAQLLMGNEKDLFKAIRALRSMKHLDTPDRKKVLKGELKLSGEKGGSTPATKSATLKESITQISLVIGAIDYLSSDSIECITGLRSDLVAFKTVLDANGKRYTTVVNYHATVKNELNAVFNFQYLPAPSASSSTVAATLKSRGQFRIVPDFGLIGVFKGDGTANFSDLVPYVGFQINFRPLNKNVQFKSIKNKTPGHRLSFMTGLTTSSIAIPNQREDLFGSNSLLTGLGFRLNNTLRVTGGMVWFKELSENPLSNQKSLSFSPSVGLSVDVEFLELIGGVKKLFSL